MEDSIEGSICSICCDIFNTVEEFEIHKESEEHRIAYLNKLYRVQRRTYTQDKNGITIDVQIESPHITYEPENLTVKVVPKEEDEETNVNNEEELVFNMKLLHMGSEHVCLTNIDILNFLKLIESDTKVILEDIHDVTKKKKVVSIHSRSHYNVKCTIKPGATARELHIPVLFEFQFVTPEGIIDTHKDPFYVGRTISITGKSYFVRNFGKYIPGIKVEDGVLNELERERELHNFYVPGWFQTLAFDNDPTAIRTKMGIKDEVRFSYHGEFFQTLLWLEELQEELDIQFYSKKNVTLNFRPMSMNGMNSTQLVELIEPGVAENRPSVMRKDKVFVCLSEERKVNDYPQWFEGIVHKVKNTSIMLGFDSHRFVNKFDNTTKFDIEFAINRHCFKVCHRAVNLCKEKYFKTYLFPPNVKKSSNNSLPEITPYDSNVSTNIEQLQAVQHMVAESSGNSPYIIFGPPGTGKTVTIVEGIKQILYNLPKSFILACAPSNTAADVIAERLLDHFTNIHVYRIYSESRVTQLNFLNPKLIEASNYLPDKKLLCFPPKEFLIKKRVIVCTFITAAKIADAKFPKNHFSHIILDEAGHAMESEALVGIGGIMAPDGHIVLAGDPHQLGPLVRNVQAMAGSRIFPKTGLDTSLLERIMKKPLYDGENGFNSHFVTKLVKNYRSHQTILDVPNMLFYNSELQAKGNPEIVNKFLNWKYLPNKEFPIIVHSVRGEDKMEKHSPSYHNPAELNQVMKYLNLLLEGKPQITPEEIGIITPYRLQVDKLRDSARNTYGSSIFNQLKIGSVEDFQGEERKVIIISTVRASKHYLGKDNLFKLGFLKNPKRFNVAVTRAQCLLILVCCADVLVLDQNWKTLIEYVSKNGGYVGNPYKKPKENIDEIVSRMEKLDLRPVMGDMSLRQMVEAPSWKKNC